MRSSSRRPRNLRLSALSTRAIACCTGADQMATKVHMEALSPTMEEGQLVKWLKHEGDAVKEGDILAEIETDKATMELVARGSGVLTGITIGEGETAPVGQQIATIAAEGEAVSKASAPAAPAGGNSGSASAAPEKAGETEKPRSEQTGTTPASEGTGAAGSAQAAATRSGAPQQAASTQPPAAQTAAAPASAAQTP